MTATTSNVLPAGISRHGKGFRVQLRFPGGLHQRESVPTLDAAIVRLAELRLLRAAGELPDAAPRSLTLGEAADAYLARKLASRSRKTKRMLSPAGQTFVTRTTRPWREGPLSSRPIGLVTRTAVSKEHWLRAAQHPKSARDELAELRAIVRFAMVELGAKVDPAILEIQPCAVERRKGVALTFPELDYFADRAPSYWPRAFRLLGTMGCRKSEFLTAQRSQVDVDASIPSLFVPADLCKEHADKWIDLDPQELALIREQLRPLNDASASATGHLPGIAASESFLFPHPAGGGWDRRPADFYAKVWNPTRERAVRDWKRDHPGSDVTPFDGLIPHDLRRTAVTAMRDAGMPEADCGARVGHHDAGTLVRAIYDQGDRRARARNARIAVAPNGIRAKVEGTAEASATPLPAVPLHGRSR